MKKLQKFLAILLAVSMCMSLLSSNAFAEEVNDGGEVPVEEEPVAGPVYRCQKEAYAHGDSCYKENWTCQLHVHETACYDAEQNLICTQEAGRDLICEAEEHIHAPSCYHVHGITCYPLECDEVYDCDKQYDCDKLYDCESAEEGHVCSDATCAKHVCISESCTAHVCGDSCKAHAHVDGCYDTAADRVCGKNEIDHYCEKVEYTHGEECYKLHEHVLGTAEESGCYQLILTCDKEEHTHSNACIPPSEDYYTRKINENINLTLYNYGSYINVGDDKSLQFGWYTTLPKGRPYEGIDGPAMTTSGKVMVNYSDVYYSNKIWNFPKVERLLNEDGYPQIAKVQADHSVNPTYLYNDDGNEIVDVSLEYLFPKTGSALKVGAAANPLNDYSKLREEAVFTNNVGFNSNYESMRFDMVGDGGLFEITEDGYYYYSCTKTSAYYDQDKGRFLLSDVLIGPGHDGAEAFRTTKNYARNFLPFNKIDFSNTDQFYQYSDTQWTYITDYAVNSDSARDDLADLWFGFDMDFDFFMPKDGKVNGKDMTFQFSGDDDIWVFIDDVLILDIAGCHGAQLGEINFATGDVVDPNIGFSNHDSNGLLNGTKNYTTLRTLFENALGEDFDASMFDGETFKDYSKHEFKFFYTERGGNISYCALKFNMPALPSGSLSVGKQVDTVDGSAPAFITDALSYEFRVLEADANGEATSELFIPAGAKFDIVDANNYENIFGSGTVGADGYFALKDGQVALFENVFTKYAGGTANVKYVVEERIPGQFSGVYGEVEYQADNKSVSNTVSTGGGAATEYLTYTTPALASDETQKVTFTNKIKVSQTNSGNAGEGEEGGEEVVDPMIATLSITKKETGDESPERQEIYQIRVLAGYSEDTMQPLSAGAKYSVGESEKTVKDGGIIELKADEIAELVFLEGTSYKVEEVVNTQYTYTPDYVGAEGSIKVDGTENATVTVINTYYVAETGDNEGGNEGGEGGSTVEPSSPTPDTPTTPAVPSGDVTIEEEPIPMAPAPETPEATTPSDDNVDIAEEDVPLANVPKTGDASALWLALSALSGMGLAGVTVLGRKKREDEF